MLQFSSACGHIQTCFSVDSLSALNGKGSVGLNTFAVPKGLLRAVKPRYRAHPSATGNHSLLF